jgi:Flp pilus assembly protein TadD
MCTRPALPLLLITALCAPARASFEEIRDLIRRGDFGAALAACDRDLRAKPEDYRVLTLRGIALQGLGRAAESLAAFRKALAIQPSFLPALQGAAQIEYQAGDPAARSTLEKLVALSPSLAPAHAMLGVLAFERKDCAEAVKHFEKALPALENPAARWQYATCLFEADRAADAEREFTLLLERGGGEPVRYNLGLIQLQAGKSMEAVATLEPVLKSARPNADTLSLLASAYQAAKQIPKAVEVLHKAIAIHPRDERLYIDLAVVCLDHNSLDVGMEVAVTGLKNIPNSSRLATLLGVLQVRAGRMEEAEKSFRQAEALAPEAAHGRVGLAVMMMQMNMPDEAVRLLREMMTGQEADPRVEATLARALLQRGADAGELEEAIALIKRSLERYPHDAANHALLGKLYLKQENWQAAEASLARAVELDPTDRTAAYQLMTIYRRSGKAREAAALQEKVRDLLAAEREHEAEAGRFRLVRAPEGRPVH